MRTLEVFGPEIARRGGIDEIPEPDLAEMFAYLMMRETESAREMSTTVPRL